MQSQETEHETKTRPNPFLKKPKKDEPKRSSRWANLDISSSDDEKQKKNNFIRSDDDGVFSSNRKDTNFRSRYNSRRSFMNYTKPAPPPKPKEFNLEEADAANEFPALC